MDPVTRLNAALEGRYRIERQLGEGGMVPSPTHRGVRMTARCLGRRFWVGPLVVLTACGDAAGPVGLAEIQDVFTMVAVPRFSVQPSASEVADLTRARATVIDVNTGDVLASGEQDIDPSASQWTFDLGFQFVGSAPPTVVAQVELASVEGGVENVEWSGRTASFKVVVPVDPQIRVVDLFRGPLANLDLTRLAVTEAPGSLLEGASARLVVSLEGETAGTRVFYESLVPAVAAVDAGGVLRALAPGTARVVAFAGRLADTVTFNVQVVVLPDAEEISRDVAPQLDYTSVDVSGTLADATGATAISKTLGDLSVALASRSAAAAVSAFESAVNAWLSYGEGTTLRSQDGPQLSLIEITLIHAADALGIPFG